VQLLGGRSPDGFEVLTQGLQPVRAEPPSDERFQLRREALGDRDHFAVVPLAGGTPHTIRNESGTDAVAFVVHAPGAPMEGFLRAGAALAAEGNPGMDAVLAIVAQHGIEITGPVPSPAR
jgi:hypothetical protein